MEQPFDTGEKSLTDFPLEKLGDVYGEVFVRPVYGDLNDIRIESGKDLLDRILNPLNAEIYGVGKQPDTLRMLSGEKPEDVYFLGDLYQSTVVTEKAVKNPEQYTTVYIREKEPYGRTLCFRDYDDGVYGYCTPEGTVIYLKK